MTKRRISQRYRREHLDESQTEFNGIRITHNLLELTLHSMSSRVAAEMI